MRAKKAGLSFSLALCGITGATPRFLAASRLALLALAFVADDSARANVGPDVEQGFEVTPVEGFAAGQIKGDDVAGGVRFCVNFRGEAAARAPERLAFLPPFAPAADTCARTTVESNI